MSVRSFGGVEVRQKDCSDQKSACHVEAPGLSPWSAFDRIPGTDSIRLRRTPSFGTPELLGKTAQKSLKISSARPFSDGFISVRGNLRVRSLFFQVLRPKTLRLPVCFWGNVGPVLRLGWEDGSPRPRAKNCSSMSPSARALREVRFWHGASTCELKRL